MGLILDSTVVIAAERRGEYVAQLIERIIITTGDQTAALSSVGFTELVHGMYRAHTSEVRQRRESYIRDLLSAIEIHAYTKETALLAGRIDGEQRNQGVVIPFTDLLIGATALEVGYSVLTSNFRHFKLIPGLTVMQYQS